MKKVYCLIFIVFVNIACNKLNQNKNTTNIDKINSLKIQLDSHEFYNTIQNTKFKTILDVRSADEYAQGAIKGAINLNVYDDNFDLEIKKLDTSKTIFVYCLTGAKSNIAAEKLIHVGFKKVYELKGGILEYNAENLPMDINENDVIVKKQVLNIFDNITNTEFYNIVKGNNVVLVDFYADWSLPCKKQTSLLDEIKSIKNDVKVIRINANNNVDLCKELSISGLPYIQLYKNGKLTMSKIGVEDRSDILVHL